MPQQYILQARHILLKSPLAVLSTSLNRTMGFRKFPLLFPFLYFLYSFISFLPQTCQTSLERLFLCLCFSRNDSVLKLLDPRGDTSFKSYECNSSDGIDTELAGISAHQYGMQQLVHYLSSLCMVMASVLFSSSIIRHPEGWMGNVLDPEGWCWLWLPYWSWCW